MLSCLLSVLFTDQNFKPAYAKSEPIELTPAQIALVRANLELVASDQNASFKSQQLYDMPLIHFSMTFYNKLFTIIPGECLAAVIRYHRTTFSTMPQCSM